MKQYMLVKTTDLYSYAELCVKSLDDKYSAIAFAHFLYHSLAQNRVMEDEVCDWSSALVPAEGSKWSGLLRSNPWWGQGFVELSDSLADTYVGVHTPENHLLSFMRTHVGASNVPHISPPNAAFPTTASPLTRENTLLLLGWIHNLRNRGTRMPEDSWRA
ncbi:hypothetical protein QJS10_CPA16g00880 [Acorus calamus]|uniref:Uncharacterized protein n=1 Tax=Acorus calamus TaxID=4465 RepID=A0AAV9D0P7_ACOCL|nr:hypothetical protein QJS10_CPA16g00880 [Acorus calamus]